MKIKFLVFITVSLVLLSCTSLKKDRRKEDSYNSTSNCTNTSLKNIKGNEHTHPIGSLKINKVKPNTLPIRHTHRNGMCNHSHDYWE